MNKQALTFLAAIFLVLVSAHSSPSPFNATTRRECELIARGLSESFADVFRFVDDLVNGLITPAQYARATNRYVIYPLNITFDGVGRAYPNGTAVAEFLTAAFDFEFTLFTHRGLGHICTENVVSAFATARPDVRSRATGQFFAFGGYVDLYGAKGSDGVFRIFKYEERITAPIPLPVIVSPTPSPTKKSKKARSSSEDSNEKQAFLANSSNGQQLDLTPFYVVLSMMVGVIFVLICGMCYLTNQFLRLKHTPVLPPKLGDAGSGPRPVLVAPQVERVRSGSTSEMV